MKTKIKRLARDLLPPVVLRWAHNRIRGLEFQFAGYKWPPPSREAGWSAEGVRESRERSWAGFVASIHENRLIGITNDAIRRPRSMSTDLQSLYLSFGYCLGLAGRVRNLISVLDWGGSTGNYYLVAKKMQPDLSLDYHCAELPAVCEVGRRVLPEVSFYHDDAWQHRQFDFVFSSSSLQYLPDWRPMVEALVRSTTRYLYITRMPFVIHGRSFVAVQRVTAFRTEYPGWVINRDEFIRFVERCGMRLVHEFVNHQGPTIAGAPEPNLYMGFLFER